MTHSQAIEHVPHHEDVSKTLLGFWVYLMTDCILFSCLFASYIVLHDSTYGGPTSQDLYSLPFALKETLILLTSSCTCGLALLSGHRKSTSGVLFWLFITFLLGASFLTLELTEFRTFVQEGNSWEKSAFLSSFFTLVGTHGTHISFGLLWMIVLVALDIPRGLTLNTLKRLTCLTMFWHFLDIVWIFIFTIVYLMGAK